MQKFEATSLYWSIGVVTGLAAILLYKMTRQSRGIAISDQVHFTAALADVSPGSFELDPRVTTGNASEELKNHGKD